MMKTHRSSKARSLGGAAILGALLVGGLGLSAPGVAQDKKDEVVENIIIKRMGKDGKDPVIINGERLSELRSRCEGGAKAESDVTSGDEKEKFRTRVVICSKDGKASTAETRERLVKALEKARAGLGEHDSLSAKGRAQASEALEREIARIRSQGTK